MASQPEHKTYPDLNVLIGHSIKLPCDLSMPGQVDQPVMEHEIDNKLNMESYQSKSTPTSSSADPYSSDPIQLVLWYHANDLSGSPFYSVDARHNPMDQRNKAMQIMSGHFNSDSNNQQSSENNNFETKLKHFVVPPYSERATFELKHHPTGKPAMLTIQSVRESDAGLYWCRVDYRWTRTTISKVRLNVLMPPKRLSIYRLLPEDSSRELLPSTTISTISANSAYSSSSSTSSAVSQLLSSIRSVNSSALSYVPIGPVEHSSWSLSSPSVSYPSSPLPSDYYSTSASIDSSSARASSGRNLLITHELTNSVVFVDEGIDTLLGCEAIGGNPVPTVSWYRNNRKLIPERIIVRSLDTGTEVLHSPTPTPSTTHSKVASGQSALRNHSANEWTNKQVAQQQQHSKQQAQLADSSWSNETNKSVLSVVLVEAPSRLDIGAILRCQATNIDSLKPIIRLIKLDVNLKPNKAVIVDMQRNDQLTAGSTVYVTCLTWGSRPPAKIRWLLGGKELFDVKELVFESNSTTKSTVRLVLNSLDNGAALVCVAENPNSLSWSSSSAQSISSTSSSSSDDSSQSQQQHHQQRHHSQQQSIPSPTPRNSNKMSAFDQITLLVKFLPNVTISVMDAEPYQPGINKFKVQSPSPSASPSAGNSKLSPSQLPTATTTTNKPQPKPALNLFSIKEGHKLTLNCKVDSNPEPFKIRWLQNRKEIFPNTQRGIQLLNHNRTLLVNSAARYQEGKYQCVAYNTLGRGDSKEIMIYILRSPRCALPPHTTIESSLQYPSNIFCQVDANPMDNVAIYWQTPDNILLSKDGKIVRIKPTLSTNGQTQNDNSLDEFDPENEYDIDELDSGNPRKRLNRLTIASKGVRSRLTIVPQTVTDFGLYRCWAENAIGSNQNEPCIFNLTNNAGHSITPRPVHNCVTNYTHGLLSIRCLHNSLGSMYNQSKSNPTLLSALHSSLSEKHLLFHLEMHEINAIDGSLLGLMINQTNPLKPIFLVSNLLSNSIYQINVYVSNLYGISDKITMLFQTSNTSSNMNVSSSSLILSSSSSPAQSKTNLSPFDDWLTGGMHGAGSYDDESGAHSNPITDQDEDVSGSEMNFELIERDSQTDGSNTGAGGQWSISKPDLQKQNRLGDNGPGPGGGSVDASHRLLVILITVLSVCLIFFSILVSIAIVLCVVRNKQKTQLNQSGQSTDTQPDNQTQSAKVNLSPTNKPISTNSSPIHKICTYDNHNHHPPPDVIPCDGVLIFNSQQTNNHFSNVATVTSYGPPGSVPPSSGPIYRDFVSLDSDSSYANYTASDASGTVGNGMTLHTLDPVSIGNHQDNSNVEPKFLCQPNHVSILNDINATGFISGQGNVQLVATGPAYTMETTPNGTQFSSPFHLVNTPFLSIQTPNSTLSHHQHHNPSLVFMSKPPGDSGQSSGQSQVNSSFSLSESPSELTYLNSNHLSSFAQVPMELPNNKSSHQVTSPLNTTTITTQNGDDFIQATTV